MSELHWKHKRVAVVGYGVEGKSSTNYFIRHGARVVVHDSLPIEKLDSTQVAEHRERGVRFITDQSAFKDLSDYDLVMRTPTFSPFHPALAGLASNQASSQTKLFLQQWRQQTIGISGTKGKGTTASLTHHILRSSGRKALIGGNIGTPLLDIIDQMTPEHVAVVELSSFQLWDLNISPAMAILLAIFPEHLDVHGSLDSYLAAKQNLLRYQKPTDLAIIYNDQPLTRHISNLMPAHQYKISTGFSNSGASLNGGKADILLDGINASLSVEDSALRGDHNAGNIAAAVIACIKWGVPPSEAQSAIPTFKPLPHRLEKINHYHHIEFYDDSIATTPEATVAAINSFQQPMVVIVGGINPSADWSRLSSAFKKPHVKGLILTGPSAEDIKQVVEKDAAYVPTLMHPKNLQTGIEWAIDTLKQHKSGIVLLSPGAKSFDQYKNYQDRGKAFQQAVKNILDKTYFT